MPRSRISSPVKIKLADAVSEGDRGQARLSILTAWDLPQIVHGFMTRAIGAGIVTAAPGWVVGVFTADCVPVLLADTECRIVGALHAGWRGTLANIADAGVRAMSALGGRPDRIRAALGPSIGVCCFE